MAGRGSRVMASSEEKKKMEISESELIHMIK